MNSYFNHSGVSRSDLANLSNHPQMYGKSASGDSVALIIGSAFDHMMYDFDTWQDVYYITSTVRPSGLMKELCDQIINISNDWDSEEVIFDKAYKSSGFKLSKDVVKERFKRGPEAWVKGRIENKDKIQIGTSEYQNMLRMRQSLLSDFNINKYFEKRHGIDLYFQVPIYWKETVPYDKHDIEIECKVLLDCILVDHNNKTVCPVDLKTTGSPIYDFSKSYIKYKYYLQASMYSYGVRHWVHKNNLDSYKIDQFRFIVCDKMLRNPPIIYKVSKGDLIVGTIGGSINNNRIKGWKDLLYELVWHKEQDLWEHPKEVYDNKGELILNELT